MKNKIFLLFLVFLLGINLISATESIYNWRYQGTSNEPSTSYYSGYWNSYSGGNAGSDYVPVSQKLKTFNGPYTEVYKQNTAPYPRPSSDLKAESNNFKAGGGYTPSSSFSGSGYGGCYSGCGYYGGYYGYNYYSPTYYGVGYSYSYYDSYYPAYYW